jgi:uncharacterized membrane protein
MNGGKVSGIALRHDLMVFAKRRQKREDRIADQITAFAGSLHSSSTSTSCGSRRESARSDLRAEVDFETNVVSEVWLEALANHLGLDVNQVYATAHDRINQARAQQAQAVAVGSDAGPESPESPGVRPGA